MPFILRVDIDKPYGSSNLFQRIISKLREDYWFPKIDSLGYLRHVEIFLDLCLSENISGNFYFRNCTAPNTKIIRLLEKGCHVVGLHAENTKTITTFSSELSDFKEISNKKEISTFSKHGSGIHKLGKNHYVPYEPEKYLEWADKLKISFPFGNDICTSEKDFLNRDIYFPKIFWIEREYRSSKLNSLEDIIKIAKDNIVPILIHPTNFCARRNVKNDFIKLIRLSKEADISWITTLSYS